MIVFLIATAVFFVILIVDMASTYGPDFVARVKDFHHELFVDEAGLNRRNLDFYRTTDYADMLAEDLMKTGIRPETALDLALDDVADVFGHSLDESHICDALTVTASQWEAAARTLPVGSTHGAWLLLAARMVRTVLPHLSTEELEQQICARSCRNTFVELIAAELPDEPSDADIEQLLDTQGVEVLDLLFSSATQPQPLPVIGYPEDEPEQDRGR